jgi:hypothetical protein
MEEGRKLLPFKVVLMLVPVVTVLGYVDQITGMGCTMLTCEFPKIPDGALVAFTVTTFGDGTTAGGVNRPVAEIVP